MGTNAGWQFELTGGALCLDFANTLSDRPRGHEEHLADYAELVSFARQAGVLTAPEARRLVERAAREPRAAGRTLAQAVALRESLYRVFTNAMRDRRPDPADVAVLNRALAPALSRLRLQPRGAGFVWAWPGDGGDQDVLERLLWPVARSAAELLVAGERPPVRECASDTCSWLFLDQSRGGRRRWCDMKTCGNRHKARRHYRRQKVAGPPPEA